MPFFEASGSSGENVDKIFYKMAEMIYDKLVEEKDTDAPALKLGNKDNKRKCCS